MEMSAKKSRTEAIVSAMGVLLSWITTLVNDVRELGGEIEDIYRLATEDGRDTVKAIARLIVEAGQKARNSYSVLLDATRSLADLVALGRYDWVNSDITAEHFPVKSQGKRNVRVELWWPNRYFNNGDEVIAELAKLNDELAKENASYSYRFAFIEELLALGASQPELQRQFPIAALGSIWLVSDPFRRFAFLDRGGAGRVLGLFGVGLVFDGSWRFALVREPARIA